MSSITFKVNIVDKELSNKQTDNMVYCEYDGCSDYFYQMGEYKICPRCRLK